MSQAKVNEICSKHKGVCTWGFSQTDFIVMKNIFSDSRTRFGICAALSAHWIKHHAHDGSLANLLGGGGVEPLNLSKLKEIKVLHSTVSGEDGGDALFFDPNYGEFWFKDKQDFFSFFPEFYRASYRSGALSFNKNWEVLPCAKRAW